MKIAHIIPPQVIRSVFDLMGDYHLTLPGLMKYEPYREFYRSKVNPSCCIMDNGVAEGEMHGFRQVIDMARVMISTEIVLPDVLFSMDKTLHAVARSFQDAFEWRGRFQYMLVAQGETVLDCISTAERAMNMFPGIINAFGVPRHILSQGHGSRLRIATALRAMCPDHPIHLLGTNVEQPFELLEFGARYRALDIRGCDTSMAWNAARLGLLLSPESLSYNLEITRQTVGEFGDAKIESPEQLDLLRRNMEVINSWA
jgi:hypothetical protein